MHLATICTFSRLALLARLAVLVTPDGQAPAQHDHQIFAATLTQRLSALPLTW